MYENPQGAYAGCGYTLPQGLPKRPAGAASRAAGAAARACAVRMFEDTITVAAGADRGAEEAAGQPQIGSGAASTSDAASPYTMSWAWGLHEDCLCA